LADFVIFNECPFPKKTAAKDCCCQSIAAVSFSACRSYAKAAVNNRIKIASAAVAIINTFFTFFRLAV
jgi:hypothetical protein